MPQPTIYRTLESVLAVLRDKKNENSEAVKTLLQAYTKAHSNYVKDQEDKSDTKHPLIVLEGLDGCGKSTVGHRLAKQLNATEWRTPPDSIKSIRELFDDHKELKVAYYALGNYIAALEIAVLLKKQPVVMDRFWHSTCAFGMAQAIHDFPQEVSLPPEGDSFYIWPEDLLKPDCVAFLNVTEDVRIQRLSRRTVITRQEQLLRECEQFRNNVITIYKNMRNPHVNFIDGNGGFKTVLSELSKKIEETTSLSLN